MNKETKIAMFVAGGMIVAGAIVYYILPKKDKNCLKNMMDNMIPHNNGCCNCNQ